MIFRQLIFSAVLIGIFSGLLLSVSQIIGVTPILLKAEAYENTSEITAGTSAHNHNHDEVAVKVDEKSHQHQTSEAWSPEDGVERTSYTFIANILASIGFASILLVFLSHFKSKSNIEFTVRQGLVWGVACYLVFFVIPSLGLPPEIPGSKADLLQNRQSWWLLAVSCSGVGLLTIAFAPIKFKIIGAISLVVPFIIGAPHIAGPTFNHPDPQVVVVLNDLHQQFIIATSVSNFIFWIALAISSTWVLKLWSSKNKVHGSNALNV